ncbi:hypothetical protein PO909_024300 [Leuciscus waleckii]
MAELQPQPQMKMAIKGLKPSPKHPIQENKNPSRGYGPVLEKASSPCACNTSVNMHPGGILVSVLLQVHAAISLFFQETHTLAAWNRCLLLPDYTESERYSAVRVHLQIHNLEAPRDGFKRFLVIINECTYAASSCCKFRIMQGKAKAQTALEISHTFGYALYIQNTTGALCAKTEESQCPSSNGFIPHINLWFWYHSHSKGGDAITRTFFILCAALNSSSLITV